MMKKLLFIITLCVVFLISCSAQEDFKVSTSRPSPVIDSIPNNEDQDDTIKKPAEESDDIIIAKNNIIAHRGAWKKNNFPQNSIASLREAIRLECKGSEFDIWLTADDSLLVHHDAIYNNLNIQESKYSQLITLKLSNGEKLPSFRDYIIAAQQNNTTTKLVCHFKAYLSSARRKIFIDKIFECINKLHAQRLVIYASDSYDFLKEVRAKDALCDTRYLMGNAVSPDQLKKDNISGAFYYDYAYYNNPEWLEIAKANNITLSVSAVNTANGINWFLKNNFDAILTDEPELALDLQKLKN